MKVTINEVKGSEGFVWVFNVLSIGFYGVLCFSSAGINNIRTIHCELSFLAPNHGWITGLPIVLLDQSQPSLQESSRLSCH